MTLDRSAAGLRVELNRCLLNLNQFSHDRLPPPFLCWFRFVSVSCLMSIRSYIRFSGQFIGSLRVCIFKSFSKINSLASSSNDNSTRGFVVFFSVVLFPGQVSLPSGLASWTLSRPMGYLRRFLSSSL